MQALHVYKNTQEDLSKLYWLDGWKQQLTSGLAQPGNNILGIESMLKTTLNSDRGSGPSKSSFSASVDSPIIGEVF